MIPLLMGLVSCGSDGGGNDPDTSDGPNANTGSDNYTDLIVTGAAGNATMDYDANFAVPITGYVNLKDEDKILYGMVMEFGVEISTSNQFPVTNVPYATDETRIIAASRLEDSRKFQVTVNNLQAETQYYYRSYISTGNNLPVYGKTLSFKTKSIKTMIKEQNMKPEYLPQISEIGIDRAGFPYIYGGKSAYAISTDKSKLTAENIDKFVKRFYDFLYSGEQYEDTRYYLNALSEDNLNRYYTKYPSDVDGFVVVSSGGTFSVDPATTYYYCVFQVIGESNATMGEIGNFKSGGYTLSELLQYVDISVEKVNPDYGTKKWYVRLNSRLGNYLPDKSIYFTIQSWLSQSEHWYYTDGYGHSREDFIRDWLPESEARNYACMLFCQDFRLDNYDHLYYEMNQTWSKIQWGEATYNETMSYNENIDQLNQYFSENGWPYYMLTIDVRIDDYSYKLKEEKWRYELPEKYN